MDSEYSTVIQVVLIYLICPFCAYMQLNQNWKATILNALTQWGCFLLGELFSGTFLCQCVPVHDRKVLLGKLFEEDAVSEKKWLPTWIPVRKLHTQRLATWDQEFYRLFFYQSCETGIGELPIHPSLVFILSTQSHPQGV